MAGVACSPRADQCVMRILISQEGQEILDVEELTKEAAQSGAD